MKALATVATLFAAAAALIAAMATKGHATTCEKRAGLVSAQASQACLADIKSLQADKIDTACSRPLTPALVARYRQDIHNIVRDQLVLGFRLETWSCPVSGCDWAKLPRDDDLVMAPSCQPPSCVHLPQPVSHDTDASELAALCPRR